MLDGAWVIRECRKNNPKAQEALYKYFAPKMMGVCALCRKSGRGEGFVAGWFYKDSGGYWTVHGERIFRGMDETYIH